MNIKEDNVWIQDQMAINEYFIRNFKELYQSSCPILLDEIDSLGQKIVTEQENEELLRIPSKEEIKDYIRKFHILKSPRPDGFSGIFTEIIGASLK